ncbi:itaconyl-CoA hydratase [Castellaniella sp. FW104-16D08]|uniref:itaconyl-CoA hydratase n=1 Tax=unclassified Castellaniella TaxID=2617606 RepID=UPI003315E01F
MTDFSSWVGRRETCHDNLDPGHVQRVALSLEEPVVPDASLPPLWHWAFFVQGEPYAKLGRDGHPQEDAFLPPAGQRNRMWAGGRIQFMAPLRVGVPAERVSEITKIVEKTGRSGRLQFMTVLHRYIQDNILCISEEQDIVYREPSTPVLQGTTPVPEAQWHEDITPDPVRLFRYSAVTFNGHRIHYDDRYVREVEGYPGLVVHGPLIATLMVGAFVRAHPECRVQSLSYRGLRPLIAPRAFQIGGCVTQAGTAQLWAAQAGTLAHQAEIQFTAA